MKGFFVATALSVLFFAAAPDALGCSCRISDQPLAKQVGEAFDASTAVFAGEVVSAVSDPTRTGMLKVRIRVTKTWKGAKARHLTIVTPVESAMCGFGFEPGNKYLVYASGFSDGILGTTNCSRTAALSKNVDIRHLKRIARK
jgi:hypothetical protein